MRSIVSFQHGGAGNQVNPECLYKCPRQIVRHKATHGSAIGWNGLNNLNVFDKKDGAGDRGRTGDVQLGNFSIEFAVFFFYRKEIRREFLLPKSSSELQ
jgi:hypothetical protein